MRTASPPTSESTAAAPAPGRHPAFGRLMALVACALAGALVSALLVQHHAGSGAASRFVQAVCGASAGCDRVNRSPASEILGLPLALYGFWFYSGIAALALIAAFGRRRAEVKWILFLALAALGADLGLLAYSIAGIGAICNLCVVTYAATAGVALLAFSARLRERTTAAAGTPADGSLSLAHAFAAIAVLASGAYVSARAGAVVPRDPVAALEFAWNSFHKSYLDTPERRIDLEGTARRGSTRPVLQMALFADFLCPHCRRTSERLIRFTEEHRDSVQLAFKHYPLDPACNKLSDSIHVGACLLARGAEAAARQNRFWHFHDVLYANQDQWTRGVAAEQLVSLAARANLDAQRFEADLVAPDVVSLVARDVEEANERLGVEVTPTLFINGRKLGAIPTDDFLEELLVSEATRLKPLGIDRIHEARVRAGH